MYKIFLDTDVILDLFLEREKFVENTRKIFRKIELREILGYTSPVILSNLYYISSNLKDKKTALSNIRKIHKILKITKIDQKTVTDALEHGNVKDFEDNLQLYSAIEMGLDFLITRNVKDFPKTEMIKIMYPEEIVRIFAMEEKKP